MKAIWSIFVNDVRDLFRNVISAIVVVGIVLVPALYAWFNTLGFWDPDSSTGGVSVAVANADEGYASDLLPMRINAGDQVVDALRANDQFHWVFVSEDEAVEGVKSGAYFAAVVIPSSFSADLMTVFSPDIKHAGIVYYSNQKVNAIAPHITSIGASTVQSSIDETFTATIAEVALGTTSNLAGYMNGEGIATYAGHLVNQLGEATDEMRSASEQARAYGELLGATASLVKATSNVLDEAAAAPNDTATLIDEAQGGLGSADKALGDTTSLMDQALSDAQAGGQNVSNAVNDAFTAASKDPAAAQKTLASLESDVAAMKSAYETLGSRLEAVDPSGTIRNNVNAIVSELTSLEQSLHAASQAITQGADAVDKDRTAAQEAASRATAAIDAMKSDYNDTLKGDLEQLETTLGSIGADTKDLSDKLQSTAKDVGATTGSLAQSLTEAQASLTDTADTIAASTDELAKSRDALKEALATGDLDKVRHIIGNDPAAVSHFLAAPTDLVRHAVYPIANNGSAMSPFYTSLALWIGAIFLVALMSVVVPESRIRAATAAAGRPPTQNELFIGRYGVYLLLALIQAVIVCTGDVFFLGVQCDNFGLFLLTGLVGSFVFSSLIYTLAASFGEVGKAIAVIILIMQIGGSGGELPVQLSAPIFQDIYPWLPFSHSMEAFRACIAGAYGDQYWVSLGLLASLFLVSLVLGLVLRRPIIRLNDWVDAMMDKAKIFQRE